MCVQVTKRCTKKTKKRISPNKKVGNGFQNPVGHCVTTKSEQVGITLTNGVACWGFTRFETEQYIYIYIYPLTPILPHCMIKAVTLIRLYFEICYLIQSRSPECNLLQPTSHRLSPAIDLFFGLVQMTVIKNETSQCLSLLELSETSCSFLIPK